MSAPRILVCTSAIWTARGEVLNVGDEAISEAVELGARARLGAVDVLRTLNRGGSSAPLPAGRVDVHPFGGVARAVRASDLVVFGGGTLLQDDRGLLRFGAALAAVCRALRTPLAVLSVGAEGLSPLRARALPSITCGLACTLSARDRVAVDHVHETLGRRPVLGADPLFLSAVRAHVGGQAPSHGAAPVLAINLRRDAPLGLLDAVTAAAQERIAAGWRVRLVAMDRRTDEDVAALAALAVRIGCPDAVETVPPDAPWRAVLAAVSGADLCVGMRLHFTIFAALAGRPTVVLTSHPKTTAFADDCGLARADVRAPAALREALAAARGADPRRLDALTARADAALARALAPLVA